MRGFWSRSKVKEAGIGFKGQIRASKTGAISYHIGMERDTMVKALIRNR
jgi:hypothetical protein